MMASARVIASPGRVALPADGRAPERFARWLLAAVAADLLVTRVIVRLAIFIPKGEPFATVGAAFGRVGAITDILVPLVGFLLLGALLRDAGRGGTWLNRASLVGVAVIGMGGLAQVYLPTTPAMVLARDLPIIGVALATGALVWRRRASVGSAAARFGIGAMAGAVALAALARGGEMSGILAGTSADDVGRVSGLAIHTIGQVAFVAGAAALGLGGIVRLRQPVAGAGRFIGAGVVATCIVLLAGTFAAASSGAILIWSLGLSGAIPLPILALILGLVIAGLPILHRTEPRLAVGAGIVLFAGYGLAASGLLLASLLGLIVSGSIGHPDGVGSAQRGIA